jgi:2-C-methyl-D-erythritol 4-phosphate cytidylyltransferase
MTTVAIIVAAGAGVRMGAAVPKALMPLAGRPMLAWSLDALRASPRVATVVVVAPPGLEREVAAVAGGDVVVVPGGASRSASVREGLRAIPADAAVVLVHDAARPLVSAVLVEAVLDGVEGADGAIAAAPAADTLKRAGEGLQIEDTVPRQGLWAAQTPQAFRALALRDAVEAAAAAGTLDTATDCASMVEARGGRVRLVESRAPNLKVTTPADAALAEALLGAQ